MTGLTMMGLLFQQRSVEMASEIFGNLGVENSG